MDDVVGITAEQAGVVIGCDHHGDADGVQHKNGIEEFPKTKSETNPTHSNQCHEPLKDATFHSSDADMACIQLEIPIMTFRQCGSLRKGQVLELKGTSSGPGKYGL
jgi:hypothetical protein